MKKLIFFTSLFLLGASHDVLRSESEPATPPSALYRSEAANLSAPPELQVEGAEEISEEETPVPAEEEAAAVVEEASAQFEAESAADPAAEEETAVPEEPAVSEAEISPASAETPAEAAIPEETAAPAPAEEAVLSEETDTAEAETDTADIEAEEPAVTEAEPAAEEEIAAEKEEEALTYDQETQRDVGEPAGEELTDQEKRALWYDEATALEGLELVLATYGIDNMYMYTDSVPSNYVYEYFIYADSPEGTHVNLTGVYQYDATTQNTFSMDLVTGQWN